jgi:hypothetical protein
MRVTACFEDSRELSVFPRVFRFNLKNLHCDPFSFLAWSNLVLEIHKILHLFSLINKNELTFKYHLKITGAICRSVSASS